MAFGLGIFTSGLLMPKAHSEDVAGQGLIKHRWEITNVRAMDASNKLAEMTLLINHETGDTYILKQSNLQWEWHKLVRFDQ